MRMKEEDFFILFILMLSLIWLNIGTWSYFLFNINNVIYLIYYLSGLFILFIGNFYLANLYSVLKFNNVCIVQHCGSALVVYKCAIEINWLDCSLSCFKGTLNVNKHRAQHEAFVRFEGSESKNAGS